MHKYRTHKCHELRIENVQDSVKLSGWVHRKRDHGQLIFIDLRDHYGLTQVVVDSSNKNFSVVENVSLESVITVSGTVVERSEETINKNLPTGNIEVNLSKNAPSALSFSGLNDTKIFESGWTLGFLIKPILFELPLTKVTLAFPPLLESLPPEFFK